jgi:hypothetical protein
VIKLLLCVSLVVTLIFATAIDNRNASHDKPPSRMLSMPEFKQCTCDSATYCLNDSDVIRLHIWYDSIKYSLGEK